MPEYGAGLNKNSDGSPHNLHKTTEYSSMHYQYMRASVIWIWNVDPESKYKPWWVPFSVPANETPDQLKEWIRRKYPGQCIATVKTWRAPQCKKCNRNYTAACKQAQHLKEMEIVH